MYVMYFEFFIFYFNSSGVFTLHTFKRIGLQEIEELFYF